MGRGNATHPTSAPLSFAAMVACVIAGFLALDHFATLNEQLLLGAATWIILLASVAPLSREDRSRALLVVVVATCAEVLGSIVLGAYTYRLENLPAFVPPGHGLVYLAGLRISQSESIRRHPRAFVGAVIAVVAGWGIAGLLLLGRTDALGAITGALLIYVLLRGSKATLYAGVFVMVAFLEIYGTSIGAWHWAATAPDTPLPAGNPPSGIASVYVLFDIAAAFAAARVMTLVGMRRATASMSAQARSAVVSVSTPGASSEAATRGAFSLSVGGSREQSTDWLLDGNDNNQLDEGGIAIFSDIDAIQEFNLQSQFGAEYGRNTGGGGMEQVTEGLTALRRIDHGRVRANPWPSCAADLAGAPPAWPGSPGTGLVPSCSVATYSLITPPSGRSCRLRGDGGRADEPIRPTRLPLVTASNRSLEISRCSPRAGGAG